MYLPSLPLGVGESSCGCGYGVAARCSLTALLPFRWLGSFGCYVGLPADVLGAQGPGGGGDEEGSGAGSGGAGGTGAGALPVAGGKLELELEL